MDIFDGFEIRQNASEIGTLKLQVELLEQAVANLREELEDVVFTVNDALLRLLPAVQVVNVELPAPQQQSEEDYTKQQARYLQAEIQETNLFAGPVTINGQPGTEAQAELLRQQIAEALREGAAKAKANR